MADTDHSQMLRRKLRPVEDRPVSRSGSRAEALLADAAARAAHDTIGLRLRGQSGSDVTMDGDPAALVDEALSDAVLCLRFRPTDGHAGVIALSGDLRAAIIEQIACGRIMANRSADRPATAIDAALCGPFLEALLRTFRAGLETHGLESRMLGALSDLRPLDDETLRFLPYRAPLRVITADVRLDQEREGQIRVLTSAVASAREGTVQPEPAGQSARATVLDSPAPLNAILHSFDVPLRELRGWRVGTIVQVPAAAMTRVRLRSAAGGGVVARARLGQASGTSALRITSVGGGEAAIQPETLTEAEGLAAVELQEPPSQDTRGDTDAGLPVPEAQTAPID